MNNLNKAIHSKKFTEACKKAAVAHVNMNKTEFKTKYFTIENDDFEEDLAAFEQSIREEDINAVKSLKDSKVEMKDLFGKNYLLDKAIEAIKSKI